MKSARPKAVAVDDVYEFVGRLVTEHTGVQLGTKQRPMVESRLQKRMGLLGLKTPQDYVEYYFQHEEDEKRALVALLTTHHTYFFREFTQFEFLSDTALDQVIQNVRARKEKTVRVWSAACSYGQEVYSLAMFLDYHLKQKAPDLNFEILGTDVDPEAVKIAANGVYRYGELKEAPLQYVGDHWVKGTGDVADFVKVRASLRDRCKFHVANLVQLKPQGLNQAYDLIFCRNVFIYFTPQQVNSICRDLLARLHKSGYLFVGVSEGLHGTDLPIRAVSSSVYQDKAGAPALKPVAPASPSAPGAPVGSSASAAKPDLKPVPERRRTLRVVCVDDSPSVLMVLKKLLSGERGFEVVGTAANGVEAHKLLQTTQADLMTLDIHMPEMNGVEYLRAHYGPKHPPVVMVTSVTRDDAGLATEALTLGASDYIEKPSLNNMNEVGEQLCTKLRTAFKTREAGPKGPTSADVAFRREVKVAKPESCIRVISGHLKDLHKFRTILSDCRADRSPIVLLMSGYTDAQKDSVWKQIFGEDKSRKLVEPNSGALTPGSVAMMEPNFGVGRLSLLLIGKVASVIVVGEADPKHFRELCAKSPQQVLIEELGANLKHELPRFADRVPIASLAFNSIEFFSRVK